MQNEESNNPSPKRLGRPKGSKNKPKRGRPKKKVVKPLHSKSTPISKNKFDNLKFDRKLVNTEEQLLNNQLNDDKLTEAGYNTCTQKIINQEPIDPSFYYRGSKNVPIAGAQYEFTADMIEELRRCKEDVIYFAENFFYIVDIDEGKKKIKLYDAQKNMLMTMVNNRFSVNLASRQSGKALCINTPIATTMGWKSLGELTTNDVIFGSNGEQISITHVHPIEYNRPCYKVTFDSGEEIIADENHEWYTQDSRERLSNVSGSIKTTKAIFASFHETNLNKEFHRIPISLEGIKYDKKNLPTDPYIIGLWLGGSVDGKVVVNDDRIDHISSFLANALQQLDVRPAKKAPNNGSRSFGATSSTKSQANKSLSLLFKKHGLLNAEHNIPDVYFSCSREQRIDLLKGIMDSCGSIADRGLAEICLTSSGVASQIKRLLCELGYKTALTETDAKLSKFKIVFKPREIIATIPLLVSKVSVESNINHDQQKTAQFHYITSVTPCESTPVRCITVDSKNSLFLAGKNLIPTHNSTLLTIFVLWITCFNDDHRAAIVANKESTAINIFKRVRMAYEQLPNYIKPGVKDYGKTGMTLGNDSSIIVSTTTATSIRGDSLSTLAIDEVAFIECMHKSTNIRIKNAISDEIKDITLGQLKSLLSAQDGRLTIPKDKSFARFNDVVAFVRNKDWQVETPSGWQSFEGICKYKQQMLYLVKTDTKSIIVTSNHCFIDSLGNKIFCKDSLNEQILTSGGLEFVRSIQKFKKDYVYDLVSVSGGSVFWANGVLNHNTHILEEFWSSVIPAVSSGKKSKVLLVSTPNGVGNKFYEIFSGAESGALSSWKSSRIDWWDKPGRDDEWKNDQIQLLGSEERFQQEFGNTFLDSSTAAVGASVIERFKKEKKEPIWSSEDGEYLVFEYPNPNNLYVIGVDVSEGIGRAASVAQVLDVTNLQNIKQVAVFASTKIEPYHFANKLHTIGNSWGVAPMLIERNNCGAQVIDALYHNNKYEKIVSYSKVSEQDKYNRTRNLGVLSHTNVRFNGIQNMRYWINHLQTVSIYDVNTIAEFETFVKFPNGTFRKRSDSFFDDRVMALVWSLFILETEICQEYFEVIEFDMQHKPLIIKDNGFWERMPETYELKELTKTPKVVPRPLNYTEDTSYPNINNANDVFNNLNVDSSLEPDLEELLNQGYSFFSHEFNN